MGKINCNVIQDILPLYIDDVVSDDTKELVEEHLQNCEICQRVYHETKADLENDMKVSDENALKGPVVFPQIEEQRVISQYFKQLDHLITLHQRELDHLQLLKKGMLQQMFV